MTDIFESIYSRVEKLYLLYKKEDTTTLLEMLKYSNKRLHGLFIPRLDALNKIDLSNPSNDKELHLLKINTTCVLLMHLDNVVITQILSEKYNEMYPKKQATETTH